MKEDQKGKFIVKRNYARAQTTNINGKRRVLKHFLASY